MRDNDNMDMDAWCSKYSIDRSIFRGEDSDVEHFATQVLDMSADDLVARYGLTKLYAFFLRSLANRYFKAKLPPPPEPPRPPLFSFGDVLEFDHSGHAMIYEFQQELWETGAPFSKRRMYKGDSIDSFHTWINSLAQKNYFEKDPEFAVAIKEEIPVKVHQIVQEWKDKVDEIVFYLYRGPRQRFSLECVAYRYTNENKICS